MSSKFGVESTEHTSKPVLLTAKLPLTVSILLRASLTREFSAPYLVADITLGVFSSLSGYTAFKDGLTYALERVYEIRGALIPAFWAGFVAIAFNSALSLPALT